MSLCGFTPKVAAIIAGIFTLFQGLFWIILAILLLLVSSCSINVSEETPQFYRMYLVYFYIAVISDIKQIKGVILQGPWIVVTSIFVILDVITSIQYSIDISYTANLEDLLEFVGISEIPDSISSYSTSSVFGNLTMAPSILAVVIFSRLLIGWTFNFLMLIHVAQDARNREIATPSALPREPRQPYQEYLHKLSTIGPVPDVKWDPYQRKRSELPILKPLKVPSPPNERKRKQSDYQQYLFYARKTSQINYLDDIVSEPPTPMVGVEPTTTKLWREQTPQMELPGDLNRSDVRGSQLPVPFPASECESNSLSESISSDREMPSHRSNVNRDDVLY